ncbi:MAG: hypothetical protein A3F95_01360 [Candidatus Nealsonbacteria bacterium RIFCSPLOWO2_12_FULL_39_31]|uniref:Uncharacterized protein n=2 Tax=Candidatus Nealsoniibacteriota TaxID=1817911 RepID=A0A1G2EP04_9BACT|nr:MAG: hypothetical protein A2626_03055 [Candidatus Nealsonbacteria bacterium RIFCSPHIGHO2_01_FULL_38_55]OGZ27523.1 MAG: hypothetical protein A3F95_01360 [Candidatus Nealsonbacteria bacterium RIFCSPLOWO2_12_FULL_39_31]
MFTTMAKNTNLANNTAAEICPVTGERERRPGCVLGWRGRQEFETLKSEAMTKSNPAPDIFVFAAENGAKTIARLQRELQRNGKEEDERLAQIRDHAEAQVAEELRANRIMVFADQRQEMIDKIVSRLARNDNAIQKIKELSKKLKRKIQLLQTYLRLELPRMKADARKKQVENWFADQVREPKMAVVA